MFGPVSPFPIGILVPRTKTRDPIYVCQGDLELPLSLPDVAALRRCEIDRDSPRSCPDKSSCSANRAPDAGADQGSSTWLNQRADRTANQRTCPRTSLRRRERANRPRNAQPKRIREVDRIPVGKPVEIEPPREPDRIFLGNASRDRIVVSER